MRTRFTKSAIAAPISSGLSSCRKCRPLHRHLRLVRPAAAKLALAADEDRAGIGVDEQLGHVACGKPGGIVLDRLHHVVRFALDRDHARPGERRAAVLARD